MALRSMRLASRPRTRRSTDHRGRAMGALEPGRPHAARLLRTVVGGWHGGGAPATRREGVPSAARHVREDAKQPVLTFGIGAADNRPLCVDVIIVLALLLWHCSFARLGSTARPHPGRPRPAATHDSPGHYNSFHADCSTRSLLEREVDPRALNLDVWRVVRVVVPSCALLREWLRRHRFFVGTFKFISASPVGRPSHVA